MLNRVLECLLSLLIGGLRRLSLERVAKLGRLVGGLAWRLDVRHRRIAMENLALCFPDWPEHQVRQTAAENFRRIGEAYACAVRIPGMSLAELGDRVQYLGLEGCLPPPGKNLVVATGHFGNFDLLSLSAQVIPDRHSATTYRAQRLKPLEAVFQRLRNRTGVQFFERRGGVDALKGLFNQGNAILALFSDQHGGGHGLWLPLLGRECSCSPAAAVMALRYDAALSMAICFRVGLARWRIECGPNIPTHQSDGTERTVEAITRDVMEAYEVAIRRDPANWFWVHRRWKLPSPIQVRSHKLSTSSGT